MTIDQLFSKYPKNIIGFRVNNTTRIIDFWFNNDWEFPKLDENQVVRYAIKKQKEDPNTNMTYYVMFSEMLTFEDLFTQLSSVIEYNLDIERKQKLFAQKMNDLKKLFVTLTYDELKDLDINSPMSLLVPKSDEPEHVNEEAKEN
jgi:hypothetical protein